MLLKNPVFRPSLPSLLALILAMFLGLFSATNSNEVVGEAEGTSIELEEVLLRKRCELGAALDRTESVRRFSYPDARCFRRHACAEQVIFYQRSESSYWNGIGCPLLI